MSNQFSGISEFGHEGDTGLPTTISPTKATSDPDKLSGVRTKNIPKDIDHGRIVELCVKSGLPDEKKVQITITNNGSVILTDLQNHECLVLIKKYSWEADTQDHILSQADSLTKNQL